MVLADTLSLPRDGVIDGRSVAARGGKRFASIGPRDGWTLAEVAACDAPDIDLAVAAAGASFEGGRSRERSAKDRKALLHRFADPLEAHGEELTLLECLDTDKPISDAQP